MEEIIFTSKKSFIRESVGVNSFYKRSSNCDLTVSNKKIMIDDAIIPINSISKVDYIAVSNNSVIVNVILSLIFSLNAFLTFILSLILINSDIPALYFVAFFASAISVLCLCVLVNRKFLIRIEMSMSVIDLICHDPNVRHAFFYSINEAICSQGTITNNSKDK